MRDVPVPFCAVRVAIDPVETGFHGQPRNVARDGGLGSRQVNLLQEGPYMEDTPPESMPGFA